MLTTTELQEPFCKIPILVTEMIRFYSSGPDEFSKLRVTKELLFVEQATIGRDMRWICRFLGCLLAFECLYVLSSNPPVLGVYITHQNLCLELLLSTVIYLVLFTTSMSHVTIGWAQILAVIDLGFELAYPYS